jgi:hypothetical protein
MLAGLITALFAGNDAATVDPVTLAVKEFAGYGVVGAVAIILGLVAYKGWKNDQARWGEALTRERERGDRAEQANTDLNREMRERIVPLLTEVNRATAEVLIALRDRNGR